MLKKEPIQKGLCYTLKGLPLAAIIISSFLPLQPVTRQLLILATLIWLQVYILLEVFFTK